MGFLSFYRIFASIAMGACAFFLTHHSLRVALSCAIAFRLGWWGVEKCIRRRMIQVRFNRHSYDFKQLLGPYGIRLINKAEREWNIKESLAEVFTPDVKKLRKTLEQLQLFDTLYRAGMRPDGDTYQLHDCKLKYCLHRLEKLKKGKGN
jgi:hypothetical protein